MPGWLAVIEQCPLATSVTSTPETVQMVVLLEPNDTANPEVAVALRANEPEPRFRALSIAKVIVCAAAFTVKLWLTDEAGA